MDNLTIDKLSPAKRELLALRLNKNRAFISRRSPSDVHPPLSFAQERLWFIQQIDPDSSAYNIPAALQLSGPLDVPALERSLREVIRRHEILRTSFKLVNSSVVQVIAPDFPFTLEIIDLTAAEDRETKARSLVRESAQRPFKLDDGPAWRASLLRLDAEEHVLLFTMHHIICDGWSNDVLVREVTTLYDAYVHGRISPLPELPIQYADYVVWQLASLNSEVIASQLEYWKQQLQGKVEPLELPTDRPRSSKQTFRGASQSWAFPVELSQALKALGRTQNATLFMVVLAAFKALLHYYSGQQQITIGAPMAHRTRAETQPLIGLFLNTLVLSTDMSGDPSFVELLQRVRDVSLGAHAHQDVPLERLMETLQPDRTTDGQPLFQATYTLQSVASDELGLSGLVARPMKVEHETAQFDLVVNGIDSKHGLTGVFEYSTDLFDAPTIARMTENFGRVLNAVIAQPDIRLSQLKQQLAEVERQDYEDACRQKLANRLAGRRRR
ncbi:MAG TPA: condensation domain-containing protein [Pyrinomonadaceae bacterium]|nr:condensation domain-containing protein [Pyrinomonadaceae bacterium]